MSRELKTMAAHIGGILAGAAFVALAFATGFLVVVMIGLAALGVDL